MAALSSKVTAMSTQRASVEIRLQPLMFSPLTADGTNFLEWVNDAKVVLPAEELDVYLEPNMIQELPDAPKWQALLILQRHLDPSVGAENSTKTRIGIPTELSSG